MAGSSRAIPPTNAQKFQGLESHHACQAQNNAPTTASVARTLIMPPEGMKTSAISRVIPIASNRNAQVE